MADENGNGERTEPGLWDVIAGFFGSDDTSPREREMVMSPPPERPQLTQRADEDSTSFSIRKSLKMREWESLMRQREIDPDSYMVPAAEAEGTADQSRFERGQAIDDAVTAAGG